MKAVSQHKINFIDNNYFTELETRDLKILRSDYLAQKIVNAIVAKKKL